MKNFLSVAWSAVRSWAASARRAVGPYTWLVLALAIGAAWVVISPGTGHSTLSEEAAGWLVLLLTVLGFLWFLDSFTGDPYEKRTKAILFAYVITFLSFLVMFLPSLTNLATNQDRPIGVLRGCVVEETEASEKGRVVPGSISCDSDSNAKQGLWLLHVGGVAVADTENSAPWKVIRGLVVPLYVVIFALAGGAVSLSRRIPEIQKRSEEAYTGTDKENESKLLPWEARELIVFQILQFISAPFIAITAYYR